MISNTIHLSIHYPYALFKRLYLCSIFVIFALKVSLLKRALLWNVSLPCSEEHLDLKNPLRVAYFFQYSNVVMQVISAGKTASHHSLSADEKKN